MFVASVIWASSAALSFALAAVFQQEAAQTTERDTALSLRLLQALLHRPKWLLGVTLLLAGYGLQAMALANGPVALVQPIVATELAMAIPIGMWRRHSRAGRREWLGILAVLAGVSVLLVAASPVRGTSQPDRLDWVLCLVPVGGVVAGLVAASRRIKGPRRAVVLGCAAGLAFSLLAVLTKSVADSLSRDVAGTFLNWQVYVLVTLGIMALVISQSAYQAGPLALSMPAIAILEPTVAVLIGDTVFHESARLSGGALALELIAAGVAVTGLLMLTTSRKVITLYEQSVSGRPRRPTGETRPRTPVRPTG